MLAEPVDSATALRLGLLTSVVADADLLPTAAAEFAARLAARPDPGLRRDQGEPALRGRRTAQRFA